MERNSSFAGWKKLKVFILIRADKSPTLSKSLDGFIWDHGKLETV